MESPEQTIRRLQRELKENAKTIRQKDKTIRQKDREASNHRKAASSLRERLELEDGLWATGADRLGTDTSLLHMRGGHMRHTARRGKISAMTGLDAGQFDHIHGKFVKESRKHGNAPLFSEDCTPDPGNRCLLDRRSVLLLLALFRKRSNVTQDVLGVIFGTDQSTVCRYLQFADYVLVKILPTADRINSMVKRARILEQFEALVPGRIIIVNGTEVPKQRPKDGDARKKTYSGKKKRFTINTTMVTNRDGLVISAGRSFEGGTHDLTMVTEDPIDLGRWSKGMYREDTPEGERMRVLADKGYRGMLKKYKGIALEMPEKKPKGGKLATSQKRRNKKISSRRMTVEHSIGRIKQWGIMTDPYDGTVDEFHVELVVVTGLANFQLLWDRKRERPRLDY